MEANVETLLRTTDKQEAEALFKFLETPTEREKEVMQIFMMGAKFGRTLKETANQQEPDKIKAS